MLSLLQNTLYLYSNKIRAQNAFYSTIKFKENVTTLSIKYCKNIATLLFLVHSP